MREWGAVQRRIRSVVFGPILSVVFEGQDASVCRTADYVHISSRIETQSTEEVRVQHVDGPHSAVGVAPVDGAHAVTFGPLRMLRVYAAGEVVVMRNPNCASRVVRIEPVPITGEVCHDLVVLCLL